MVNPFISHIATIEIPVRNIEKSVDWYQTILGVKVLFTDDRTAMLRFESKHLPTIYLVQTYDNASLSFQNTNNEITHTIIDFYTPSLIEFYNWLNEQNVETGSLNIDTNHGFGGFSFKDLNGNLLSATNILDEDEL